MHRALILSYISLQALVLAPIAPHWSEHIHLSVLSSTSSIQSALWPVTLPPDAALTAAREYVRATSSSITSAEAAQQKRKDKGKAVAFDPKRPKRLTVFVARSWPAWQEKYIALVREMFDAVTLSVDEKKLMGQVSKMGETKKAMPFVQGLKKRVLAGEGEGVWERKLPFDEVEVLGEMVRGLRRTTGCGEVRVVEVREKEGGGKVGRIIKGGEGEEMAELPHMAESAVPGVPTFFFENVE